MGIDACPQYAGLENLKQRWVLWYIIITLPRSDALHMHLAYRRYLSATVSHARILLLAAEVDLTSGTNYNLRPCSLNLLKLLQPYVSEIDKASHGHPVESYNMFSAPLICVYDSQFTFPAPFPG
jgi:hypothetical protein